MNWDDTFFVVDVEGNGSRPPEMVELAIAQVKALRLTGVRHHWLIRPREPISAMATRIHGIRNEDLDGAPDFEDIADDVMALIDGVPIVGHNVRIEVDVLKRSLPDWEPIAAVDTLKLAKAIRPGLPSYSLTNLSKSLGISVDSATDYRKGSHSAPHDVLETAALMALLLNEVPQDQRSAYLNSSNIVEAQKGLSL